ncbi:Permease of the drug/metabolite transporter (DMT) superfamily [Tistlia consotensis]|uniref:Permease of the drug/metabolite transporter (DMT) superfamily n=1 Tax=Tistlia consotensis USBA 355 TaxID=560819 RepID=A0A1Y6BAQ6_9PROT|nr:DMT family transporter [Tistlia consotensis]SME94358.1 Permease of the drug/metabolite transporter (DMT) superfamily [Tistlia consotensis USBA 355]SNR29291.1 Permease of the drug/metabolite transporter (DMT) superfamily [Tistlia consotensis]
MRDAGGAGATKAADWLPLVLLLVVGTLWGATFSIGKIAVTHGIPPAAYAFFQSAGAGSVLLVLALLRGELARPRAGLLLYGLVAGTVGLTLPNVNFTVVIQHLEAGTMSVVITLSPLATYVGALLLGMERRSLPRLLGLLCGFAGALVLLVPGATLPGVDQSDWILLGILTPLCYSAQGLFAARFMPPGVGSLRLARLMLFGAALTSGIAMLASDSLYVPQGLGAAEIAMLLQIAVSSIAYVVVFEVLRRSGPVFFSQVGYVVTVTGVLWGMVIFGERPTAGLLLAGLLVLGGLFLVNRRPARPPA